MMKYQPVCVVKTHKNETRKLKLDPMDPHHILRVNEKKIPITYVSLQQIRHSYVKFPVGRQLRTEISKLLFKELFMLKSCTTISECNTEVFWGVSTTTLIFKGICQREKV